MHACASKVNMKEVCSGVGFAGEMKVIWSKGFMRASESVLESGRNHRVG